jgi:hypothetical protein
MATPKFVPTKEDRHTVEVLSGCHVRQDDIARVILNPATRRPISVTTLKEAFREELKGGSAQLRNLVFSKFVEKIKNGDWPALQFALRYLCGLNEGTIDKLGLGGHSVAVESSVGAQEIRVSFVRSEHQNEPAPGPLQIEHRPLLSDDGKHPDWAGTMPRATPAPQPGPTPKTASKVAPGSDLTRPEFRDRPSGPVSIFDPKKGGQGWMS